MTTAEIVVCATLAVFAVPVALVTVVAAAVMWVGTLIGIVGWILDLFAASVSP